MSVSESAFAESAFEHAGDYADEAVAPVRLRQPSRIRHALKSFLAAIAIATMAVLLFMVFWDESDIKPAGNAAPTSTWAAISKPIQLYSVQSAEFGKEVRLYEARRHVTGGGRQDMLAYGAAELGTGAALRISIYRPGAEPAPESTLFVDLARLAALSGLAIERSAQPDLLQTRFGGFEVADMTLTQGAHGAACLGFRLTALDPVFSVAGFACGGAKPIDRATLACALDRLDLISAGGDRDLAKFFIAAEQGRGKNCAAQRGAGVKATWLDHTGRLPALRAANDDQKTAFR